MESTKDVINYIANFCQPTEIAKWSATCKRYHSILSNHRTIIAWKNWIQNKSMLYCLQQAGNLGHHDIIDILLTKYQNLTKKEIEYAPDLYHNWTGTGNVEIVTANSFFYAACEAGHWDLIQRLLNGPFREQSMGTLMKGLKYAAKAGRRHLVQVIIQKLESGAHGKIYDRVDWTFPLEGAALGGHSDLVDLFIRKGASKRSSFALEAACEKGHLNLVNLFLEEQENMQTNLFFAICSAAEGGHLNVVRFLLGKIHKESVNWDHFLAAAACGGHRDVVDFFIAEGATDWDWALGSASYGGHHNLIQLFFEKGADPKKGVSEAVAGGHKDTALFLLNLVNKE